MLRGALDFLDVNDLASVNLVIAEASGIHLDLVSKQKNLENRINESKISKMGDRDRHYQTVSANNITELNNNMYVQMSNALTGAPVVNETKKNLQNH